jgi:sirohydrochlorin cobaltochelatase
MSAAPPLTALILAGHGSHLSPETAGLVWRCVDQLRGLGVADEVTAAFWKEAPALSTVLRSVTAPDVTVIPMFTAQGYFTQTVIPAEMGLRGAVTHQPNRLIRYAPTLSEHPRLAQILQERVQSGLAACGAPPDQVTVALIGHSTRRTPQSRRATEHHAQQLRDLGLVKQVVTVYLDDDPAIPTLYTLTDSPTILAIPYFLAAGSHTTVDVPTALGLPVGARTGRVAGRMVYYTDALGSEQALLPIILALAEAAGMRLKTATGGGEWTGFPSAGRTLFVNRLRESAGLQIGELWVTQTGVQWGTPPRTLMRLAIGELRNLARTPAGQFRSLTTATGLPGAYVIPTETPEKRFAVVETIYPGVVAEWALAQSGDYPALDYTTALSRQTGMFKPLLTLSADRQAVYVESVCVGCVRSPVGWGGRDTPALLPCPEPCNHWLSAALDDQTPSPP